MIGAIFGDILGSTYEFGVKDKEIYLIHDEDHFTDGGIVCKLPGSQLIKQEEKTEADSRA